MSKLMVNLFGWVPVVGPAIMITYISKRAFDVVNSIKIDNNTAQLNGQELENHIKYLSTRAYEEHLESEVDEIGLPGFLTARASEKAIDIISKKLKEKYIQKVI
jgi:hypothetical protein